MDEGVELQQFETGHIGIAEALSDQWGVEQDVRRLRQPGDGLAPRRLPDFATGCNPDSGMGCMEGRKRQRSGHGNSFNDLAGTKGQQLSADHELEDAIRKAAMTSKAWPYEEARKLLKRWPDGKSGGEAMLFETGYGPSGLPHIGTFNEVLRTTMVRHAFEELTGAPTRLIAFSDDMDGLRKVPDNVPNRELLGKHLDQPLTKVPDPF
ncbi:MAG: lysine--tRNA ligase, partial [Proteobacteria bacterium]|nr:lysine--tRNA ligase [Pseudomonadota bacterium]